MIATRALEAVQALIEEGAGNFPVLDELTISLRDSDETKTLPHLTLTDIDAQEHPVLYGMQFPLVVEALLSTVANSEGSDQDATTQEEHEAYADALRSILADYPAAETFIDSRSGITCKRVSNFKESPEANDNRRETRMDFELVCCLQ